MAAPLASMNGLLYAVGIALEEVHRDVVTAPQQGVAATFLATGLKQGDDDDLVGSEVWWESTTGMTARNPQLITANVAASGLVTLNADFGVAAPPVGAEFVIGNVRASGKPHQQKLTAILLALADLGLFTSANVAVTLDTATSLHTIPAGIDTVYAFEYLGANGITTLLPASQWREGVNRATRTLYLPIDFTNSQTLTAYGRVLWSEPTIADYNLAITKRPADVVRGALAWLRSGSTGRAEQASARSLMELALRRGRQTLRPNEIILTEG